jgi:type II secretory pathway predicted ATPase ExeA
MYYEYFGLNQPPFKITPDTSLFFPGGNRGAVLQALIYAITEGEGIVKVVGEVGSGKTMLCRMLEVELPENVEVVYLANPSLSPENILHAIAFELKLNVTETDNRLKVMNELQNYLVDRHADNRQIVVFVEEAQGMPIATLEEIRLLSNLETTQHKLLQIVLFGQPELDEKIATREIRQLKERITYSFQLAPFKGNDVKDYLNSRMRTCGYRSEDVFSASAVSVITKYSKGLLRRINILADKSLLAAYATNTHKVTASHVKTAARDSEFLKKRTFMKPVMAALVLLVLTAGFLSSVNINQGIQTIQKSFATYAKSINTRLAEVSVAVKNMTLVEEDPEGELPEVPGLELPNGPDVVEVEVAEITEEEQIDTVYLTHDSEIVALAAMVESEQVEPEQVDAEPLAHDSEVVALAETVEPEQAVPVKATVASTEDNNFMDISALIKGTKIRAPSDLDVVFDDENVEETSYLSEKEDVSSVPSAAAAIGEVVAIGLSEDEFERFQKQLLEIPPEIKSGGGPGIVCEKCSSIIYRPVL